MATKNQTLSQAIKAVRAYAQKHGQIYFSVQLKWQSDFHDINKGKFGFSAYIHTFTHVDSDTIEGLIAKFDNTTPTPDYVADDDDLLF